MSKHLSRIALAGAAILVSAAAAQAGGHCHGSACYRLVKTPPAYQTVSEQVMVRPAQRIARHIPAEYGSVAETVVVRPERTVARHIPAVYGTTSEKVMVSPARQEWRVTYDAHGNKVGCWVKVPAQFAVQHRQVVIREAQVAHETIPAVTTVRHRKVVVRPAAVTHDVIPAEYSTRHRHVMVHPGSKSWQAVGRY